MFGANTPRKAVLESETRDLVAHIALFIGIGFFRTRETRLYKTKRVHQKETGTAIDAHPETDGHLSIVADTHTRAHAARGAHTWRTRTNSNDRAHVVDWWYFQFWIWSLPNIGPIHLILKTKCA